MNLYEIRPSSACFNPLQLVYPMYVQKWKVQSETNHGKIYVPLTNGLIFTRKKNQQSSAHRSSYFWNSVTDVFQTDAGNGPLWINRDSNSNVMWNWRNPHFDQPLTNHVQLELFPWKVKESGTTTPLISTNITALICDVAPNFWILPKKTALRNGVGPTQTLVSSSVYVSS